MSSHSLRTRFEVPAESPQQGLEINAFYGGTLRLPEGRKNASPARKEPCNV